MFDPSKPIPLSVRYRFYQTDKGQMAFAQSLEGTLLAITHEQKSGAVLLSPDDGLDRFKRAIAALELFIGSPLTSCGLKVATTSDQEAQMRALLASAGWILDPTIVPRGTPIYCEPAAGRMMVLARSNPESKKIRVVIVDDSKTIRQMLTSMLSRSSDIEVVGEADRPSVAKQVIEHLKPDVVTLDMNMPEMSGTEFVEATMPYHPVPFVLVTAIGLNEGDLVLRALAAGAVDYVQKPSMSELETLQPILIEKIKAAASARLKRAHTNDPRPSESSISGQPRSFDPSFIAIGASTGGTEAIRELLSELPDDVPPLVITQHIPPVFSSAFASRLNGVCRIEVREAADGDKLEPGLALIAPGDMHMRVIRSGSELSVTLDQKDKVTGHRPSVDVLFHSLAKVGLKDGWAFLLTGMGRDGADGLLTLKNLGNWTAAQDEASSVVYGMPRVAFEIGATCSVLSLYDIQRILMRSSACQRAG